MIDTSVSFKELSLQETSDILCSGKNVLILFHVHPDGDCIGSAFALKDFLEGIGSRAWCICADEVPQRLSFAVQGVQDSCTLGSIPEDFKADLIVSVDTASPSQLGSLYEVFEGKIDLMIDHHAMGVRYADNYVLPGASACGEVLYDVLKYIAVGKGIENFSPRVHDLLYMAISSDTGCFRYNNVGVRTHQIAAGLVEQQVDIADINHKLFGIKTLKQMQVEHAGFERMNFYNDGKIAIITFPYDLKSQYGATDENLETLIDVARCIRGVEVCAVVKQLTEENRFRVSMRSSTDFDVSEICSLYGGGGHKRAAGCSLNSSSILAAEMTIVSAVENKFVMHNE